MNERKIQELEQSIQDLRTANKRADLKPLLNKAFEAAESDAEKAYILGRLASEWQRELATLEHNEENKQKFDDAESAIRRCIELQPEDPYNWIMLAEYFHYYAIDLPKALEAINTAIEKAEAAKEFVRQAHGVRIRLSLDLKEYGSVEASLRALVKYRPSSVNPDVSLEKDFLERIPVGAVNGDLITQYTSLL
jgi:tetratricopeptide (TPR) repeat protein